MMENIQVEILGAGSIGNHLAHGCRGLGWNVRMIDLDPDALARTRNEIYPQRYGAWDEEIALGTPDDFAADTADVVIIGTPPDTHVKLMLQAMREKRPRVLLVEKPLATPDLAGCAEVYALAQEVGCTVLIDYNHTLTANTRFAADLLQGSQFELGDARTIQVRWIEHWGGIFKAHPWLSGPADTYLGFASRGGGACGEHSHGINIWQRFAKLTGAGRITEVTAMMDLVQDGAAAYDRVCQLCLKTESGLTGFVVQDVVSEPPVKNLRLQGENGFVDWYANHSAGNDALIYGQSGEVEAKLFPKDRPEDFKGMIEQIRSLLAGELEPADAVSTLEDGLETMMVIAAAFRSHETGARIRIDYSKGFQPEALIAL